jgi:hypothetical protein
MAVAVLGRSGPVGEVSHRVALVRKKVRSAVLDVRFRGLLNGSIPTRYAHLGAMEVANTDYDAMGAIFAGVIRASDVLVDVGCGKGRVLNWWLSRGYTNEIIGLELDEEVAEHTRRRLRRYRQVSIVSGDAVETLPGEGTLFYLFNPFRAPNFEAFSDRLAALHRNDPGRQRRVIYYHPVHLRVFEHDPRWEVVYRKPAPTLWSNLDVAGIRPVSADVAAASTEGWHRPRSTRLSGSSR